MSWDDLVSEVGPWLPEDKQELPLKLFDGYKVSDIATWTIRSGSLYMCNELVPNRKVDGEIDGVSVNGTKPIGPALIVAKPDGDQMWSQEQYAQYFANAKKSYVDGDHAGESPTDKLYKASSDAKKFVPGDVYIDGKKVGHMTSTKIEFKLPPEQSKPLMRMMGATEEEINAMTKKAEKAKRRDVTVLVHEPGEVRDVDDSYNSVVLEVPAENLSDAGRRILTEVIPEVVQLFLNKSNDYKNAHESLGPKAQYVDLHRKMGKLKSALWEGQELQYEQVDEILMDLAGHVFLALDGINKESNK